MGGTPTTPDYTAANAGETAALDVTNPRPGDVSGVSSNRSTPQGPQPPAPPTNVSAPPVTIQDVPPNIVKPARRGGLAGVLDGIADTVAGTQGHARIYKDSEGNEYIEHPTLSRKQQWLKIAGEAVRGAAAGAAAKPGPGQLGRAALAGVEMGDQTADRLQAQEEKTQQQVRQDNIDRFNLIKMKHDMDAKEFELQRLKVKANQEDILFAQEQLDRMNKLVDESKAFDLGSYKDEAELAKVKEVNPNFWKDAYKGDVTIVPNIGPDGARQGVHVFQTLPGIGNEQLPEGSSFKVFVPPTKPGDDPKLEDHVASGPMTFNQKHARDLAAAIQMQTWQVNQATIDKKEGTDLDTAEKNARIRSLNSETALREQELANQKELSDPTLVNDIRMGRIIPERLGYLLGKKEGQELLTRLAAFGDIDTSKLQAYPKMYNDFVSGKTSQSMRNLNTAMQHIEDLRALNTYKSRIPGTEDARAFDNKLVSVSAEVANALAKPGATATKEEIAKVQGSLAGMVNRDAALKTQINSMVEQYKTLRNVWAQGAPSAVYEAKMPDLSPEAKMVIIRHAPEDAAMWWHKPSGATSVAPSKVDGQLHWTDGKTDLGVVQN